MPDDDRPQPAPRGRRLPAGGRGLPAGPGPAGPVGVEQAYEEPSHASVGLGSLSVSLVARGDVTWKVRRKRYIEAVLAATGLALLLLAMFVLWLWYEPPPPPLALAMAEPEVELGAVVLGKEVRIRRPERPPPPERARPGPAWVVLPDGHEVLSWRLDCPGADNADRGSVGRDQKVIRISVVPPAACTVVLTSPGGSKAIPISAGSGVRCRTTSTLVCR